VEDGEIKNSINNAYGLNASEKDIEIIEALLEMLYEEEYIDRPVHLEIVEERIKKLSDIANNETQLIKEGVMEEEVEIKKVKVINKKTQSIITENNIWASLLIGFVIFGAYVFYNDYKEDKLIEAELTQKIQEKELLKEEVLEIKKVLGQGKIEIKKLRNTSMVQEKRIKDLKTKIIDQKEIITKMKKEEAGKEKRNKEILNRYESYESDKERKVLEQTINEWENKNKIYKELENSEEQSLKIAVFKTNQSTSQQNSFFGKLFRILQNAKERL